MKKKEANLLYLSSKDGLDSKILWTKCQNHSETITSFKTNQESVIGFIVQINGKKPLGRKTQLELVILKMLQEESYSFFIF